MPDYSYPGVYLEESPTPPRPIEGVSTSTAGFLGTTRRGPETPRRVTSVGEFTRLYGGYSPVEQSALPFAVHGFFENGGRRCVIGRVAAGDAQAMTADLDGRLRLTAVGRGEWANRIAAKVEEGLQQPPGRPPQFFTLTVMYWDVTPPEPLVDPTDPARTTDPNRREPTMLEVYNNLTADRASPDFYATRVTAASSLVRAEDVGAGVPAPMPLAMLAALGTPGTDGSPLCIDDYKGRELNRLPDGTISRSGLAGFEEVDDIAIVVAPDHHALPELTTALIAHCNRMGHRFAILHSHPTEDTLANIDDIQPPQDTADAAFYFPWIAVLDPLLNQDVLVPPSGHVAGIYARTDVERGVFTPPANEVVVGARSLQFHVTQRDQERLHPRGVNCVREFPGWGIRLWGARTASSDPEWKYVNVRRFLLFLKASIHRGTQWVAFELNDERLWARVRLQIEQFLLAQWRAGAFPAQTAEEAFFVKVDRTTMTQDDIDSGRLTCLVGVALVKPAEFVIFRIGQFTSGAQERGVPGSN